MAGPVRFKRGKRRFGPKRPTKLEGLRRPGTRTAKVVRPGRSPKPAAAPTTPTSATPAKAPAKAPSSVAQIDLAKSLTTARSLDLVQGRIQLDELELPGASFPDGTPQLDPEQLFGDRLGGQKDNPVIRIFRPADMVELLIVTLNLRVTWPNGGQSPGTLALTNPNTEGKLLILTAAQHIAEDTVHRGVDGFAAYSPPLARAAAAASRVVLTWPAGQGGVPFRSADLLERIASLPLAVRPQSEARTGPVGLLYTALELPWRLTTSPNEGQSTRLRGPYDPIAGSSWTELHRLRFEHQSGTPELGWRALTSPDLNAPGQASNQDRSPAGGGETMFTSLSPATRSELVHLSDNPWNNAAIESVRAPFVGQVMLSTLGADARFEGSWGAEQVPTPQEAAGVDLIAWTHHTRMARDTHVRVVTGGYLYPFGFPAARVQISEREVDGTSPKALLARRVIIIIRQRVVERDATDTPFVRFEVALDQTDLLDERSAPASKVDGLEPAEAFWPRSGGRDIQFPVVAIDRQGRRHRLDTGLIFVRGSEAFKTNVRSALQSEWTSSIHRHEQNLGGATVAYAGATDHDAALPTMQLRLAATGQLGGVPFAARLDQAEVKLAAVDALGGSAGTLGLRYASAWVGNPATNPGKVWAEFLSPVTAGPASEILGGMASLSLAMSGLALGRGPVTALAAVASGNYAGAVMGLLGNARLLGGLSLADLVNRAVELGSIAGGDGEVLPRVTFDPRSARAVLHWEPEFGDLDLGFVRYDPPATSPQGNLVHAEVASDGTHLLHSRLRDFTLTFAGALALTFAELGYRNESGRKPEVTVELDEVAFLGPLTFVNDLKDLLSFGEGFAIDILGPRLEVRSGFSLPQMALGMFELADLAIGAELSLPFDGSGPSIRFAISRREAPFLVAVCGVGGGGWLALDLDTSGVRGLEIGLFAAGSMSLNLGVASGGVSIKVGVTFAYDGPSQTAVVTAFIEVAGVLSVLGLITVSVTFYLGLTYTNANGKAQLRGTASVRVKVSVLFFSTSVTLSVERELAGSDPPFSAQTTLADWKTRQLAYA